MPRFQPPRRRSPVAGMVRFPWAGAAALLLGLLALAPVPAAARQLHRSMAGGTWSNPGGWLEGVTPTAADTVIINLAGSYTVVVDAAATVARLALGGATGANPTLSASSWVNSLTLGGPSVVRGGATLAFVSGTLAGPGPLDVIGTLRAEGPSCTLGVPLTVSGLLDIAGQVTLDAPGADHVISGQLALGGSGRLTVVQTLDGASFSATGSIGMTAGDLVFDGTGAGATSVSLAGSTITATTSRSISVMGDSFDSRGATITNLGALYVSQGAVASIGTPATSQLSVSGATVSCVTSLRTSQFRAPGSNAVLDIPELISDQGGYLFNYPWPGLTLNGRLTLSTDLLLTGNTVLNGPVVVPSGRVLVMERCCGDDNNTVTVNSTLLNSGQLSVRARTFDCRGGYVENKAGAKLWFSPSNGTLPPLTLRGTVNNSGQLSVQDTTLPTATDALVNDAGGLLQIYGTLTMNGPGTRLGTGTINLAGSGISPLSSTLALVATTLEMNPGSNLTGIGQITLQSGAAMNVGGSMTPGGILVGGDLTLRPTALVTPAVTTGSGLTTIGRLNVVGNLQMDGTLRFTYGTPPQAPTAGTVLTPFTYGTRSGAFPVVDGLAAPGGTALVALDPYPAFGATAASFQVVRQSWTQLSPAGAPPPRERHGAGLDWPDNRLVLFGGRGAAGVLNDVWVLPGANGTGTVGPWSALAPTGTPPAARCGHTTHYDEGWGRLIVYGGDDDAQPTPNLFADAFILVGASGLAGTPAWQPLPASGGPGPLTNQGSAYNPFSNVLILFGGQTAGDACVTVTNDVWLLTHANGVGGAAAWTHLAPLGTPPAPRRRAVVAYDNGTNRLFVHGGDDGCGGTLADAWMLTHADGTGGTPTWSPLALTNAPAPALTAAAGGYDPQADRMITFGGLAGGGSATDTAVLLLDAASPAPVWSLLPPPTPRPAARRGHTLAFDAGTRRFILTGGRDATGALRSDTWVLQMTAENDQVSAAPPAPAAQPGPLLGAPWPNPTSGAVTFRLQPTRPGRYSAALFDVAGRRVRALSAAELTAGPQDLAWDGRDDTGRAVGAGIYFLRVSGPDGAAVRRLVISR